VETATTPPELGQGVYTFPEAARILRGHEQNVTPRQLRYWIKTGLTPVSHRTDAGFEILSFDDLISLELVRRFRSHVSLQRVRKFEHALREHFPQLERPFAYELFFTDGASIWARANRDDLHAIELVGRHRDHYVWSSAIQTFSKEIRFAGSLRHAEAWELSTWVEIDPARQFGAPVVRGTRIPIQTIEANLEVGTPSEVAEWYGLSTEQVEGVRDYLVIGSLPT
jgi:uncharacterized protein (DUF433 family)/DNA-binding transcriptional MerR regulator